MKEYTLSELSIYPVKSCGGISVQSARVDSFGLEYDRRWMVVDEEGRFLSQRNHARMCLIQPSLSEKALHLDAPEMPSLVMDKQPQGDLRQVRVWDDQCQGIDCGDQVAQWFSRFLQTSCRVVFFPDDEIRQIDTNFARPGEVTAFSDGFQLLLTSEASLSDLNERLPSPVPMNRFRPNLVVCGNEAFEEDQWHQLRVGDMAFRVVKPCSRCIIPAIDQETAERHVEPLATLTKYRKRGNKVFFGQNLIANGQGEVAVGMKMVILS